jgi:pyruvate,water dikinase
VLGETRMKELPDILWLEEIKKEDIVSVGGKGASLGEMASIGLPVPKAFVVTAQAFRRFLIETGIEDTLFHRLQDIDVENSEELENAARDAKEMVLGVEMPSKLKKEIQNAYQKWGDIVVAVRSSATAEDLPDASFAGQQDTFLNIKGAESLLEAVQKCWASLYGARAIY